MKKKSHGRIKTEMKADFFVRNYCLKGKQGAACASTPRPVGLCPLDFKCMTGDTAPPSLYYSALFSSFSWVYFLNHIWFLCLFSA